MRSAMPYISYNNGKSKYIFASLVAVSFGKVELAW
jgi:hypothetical protein